MEDLYGTTPSSATGMASESEDIANILNQLLQSSSSSSPPSSSSFTAFRAKYAQTHQATTSFPDAGGVSRILGAEERVRFARSDNRTEPDCRTVEASPGAGSPGFGFSDPTGGLNAFSDANASLKGRRISPENDFGDFSCDSEGADASDVPSNSAPAPRSSSKRSRAAEVHNMSEKRRRSRINEKMKALQNLIPNSNKTDKASMLDEAIEYLKQLQLQVQMLTMRNGLSLHPMCLPMQLPLPQTGLGFNEAVKFPSLFSGHDETAVQPTFALSNACTISTQPVALPSNGSLVFEQPTQTRFRPVNLQTSTAEIRDEGKQLARSSPKSPDI